MAVADEGKPLVETPAIGQKFLAVSFAESY
jgi:hypothetical protein